MSQPNNKPTSPHSEPISQTKSSLWWGDELQDQHVAAGLEGQVQHHPGDELHLAAPPQLALLHKLDLHGVLQGFDYRGCLQFGERQGNKQRKFAQKVRSKESQVAKILVTNLIGVLVPC